MDPTEVIYRCVQCSLVSLTLTLLQEVCYKHITLISAAYVLHHVQLSPKPTQYFHTDSLLLCATCVKAALDAGD